MSVNVHMIEMTPAEKARAFDVARDLAHEFRANGPDHDRDNSFPFALVAQFRDSGLAALNIPKRFGGWGGDVMTTGKCVEILAEGDPACALAVNMHLGVVGFFRGMWSEEIQQRYFPGVAEHGHLFDGAYSETRAGVTGLADTIAVPVNGGYRVSGRKSWATLSPAADFHTFNATITDPDGTLPENNDTRVARETMFLCPSDAEGVSIEKTWDALGMRATGTETVVFDNMFVPEMDLVARNFRSGLFANLEWQTLSFASIYLGLARRACAETLSIVRDKRLGPVLGANDVRLRDQQTVQTGLGEMQVWIETTANAIEVAARRLNEGRDIPDDPAQRLAYLEIPKVIATENAIKVVDAGMRLVGGVSYRRGHVLEKLYRDARSGPFHPLTTDQTMQLIGQGALVDI